MWALLPVSLKTIKEERGLALGGVAEAKKKEREKGLFSPSFFSLSYAGNGWLWSVEDLIFSPLSLSLPLSALSGVASTNKREREGEEEEGGENHLFGKVSCVVR